MSLSEAFPVWEAPRGKTGFELWERWGLTTGKGGGLEGDIYSIEWDKRASNGPVLSNRSSIVFSDCLLLKNIKRHVFFWLSESYFDFWLSLDVHHSGQWWNWISHTASGQLEDRSKDTANELCPAFHWSGWAQLPP